MDLWQVARGAPYRLVTSLEECPFEDYWTAVIEQQDQLLTIYQSTKTDKDSWFRLKDFCQDHGLTISHVLVNGSRKVCLSPNADGYFYTKRIRRMMAADPRATAMSDQGIGIGELHGDILTIHWLNGSGTNEVESRKLELDPPSLIRRRDA
jgi:hypothetical protein